MSLENGELDILIRHKICHFGHCHRADRLGLDKATASSAAIFLRASLIPLTQIEAQGDMDGVIGEEKPRTLVSREY